MEVYTRHLRRRNVDTVSSAQLLDPSSNPATFNNEIHMNAQAVNGGASDHYFIIWDGGPGPQGIAGVGLTGGGYLNLAANGSIQLASSTDYQFPDVSLSFSCGGEYDYVYYS